MNEILGFHTLIETVQMAVTMSHCSSHPNTIPWAHLYVQPPQFKITDEYNGLDSIGLSILICINVVNGTTRYKGSSICGIARSLGIMGSVINVV